jgi:Fur family ferric uptake transcriptional regulator
MTRSTSAGRETLAPAGTQERSTRQRRIIRAVFEDADRPLSIEELLLAAQRGQKAVSLSTVYRFVRALVDDGTVEAFEIAGRGVYYELSGKAHHHHFRCIRCGRVYELNDCISVDELTLPQHFAAVSHDLTVTGICAACTLSGVI